jgi:hypothetical protein
MPFTIIGAIGTLWTSVIVNSSTGLGALIPAVMGLEFLNPIFSALNFATIGCISLAICFAIGGGIRADETFIETMQRKYEELYESLHLEVGHADIVPCRYRSTSNIIGALTLFYSQHPER